MINKNILEVCLSPDLGGLELYMSKCAKYLSKDFNIVSLIAKNSKLEKYYKDGENKYFTLKGKNEKFMEKQCQKHLSDRSL